MHPLDDKKGLATCHVFLASRREPPAIDIIERLVAGCPGPVRKPRP